MDESAEAYQQLIQRLGESLPDVAAQVRDEVARGRLIPGAKLSAWDREERESRMYEANVGKIAKADVASVPYTDEERLALLIDSLLRTAATMLSSRRAISEIGGEPVSRPVVFEEPDGTDQVVVDVFDELAIAADAVETINRLLAPTLDELGGTP